jgi:hypothetical protein
MESSVADHLSIEIAEAEIDAAYKANLLLRRPFADAAWRLLAFVEDSLLRPFVQGVPETSQSIAPLVDDAINALRYSLAWLYTDCAGGKKPTPTLPDDNEYEAAWKLFELARDYLTFATVFPLAHRKIIDLSVVRRGLLRATHALSEEPQYEAYNHLSQHGAGRHTSTLTRINRLAPLIANATSLRPDGFVIRLNPGLVSEMTNALRPVYDSAFTLPSSWRFGAYSLEDFKRVFMSLAAIAMIWTLGRRAAARSGCFAMGYKNSVILFDDTELLNRVRRYSSVDSEAADAILRHLTYGECGVRRPDPALQPIIRLSDDCNAIAPQWWLGLAPERNLTVLLNQIPEERQVYSDLVRTKEHEMRSRILEKVAPGRWQVKHGGIPGSTEGLDLDLGIVDRSSLTALIVELKWFIDPAEVRELVQRTEELETGISQLRKRVVLFQSNDVAAKWLGIDSSFSVVPVLVSANWIGFAHTQVKDIPIIREDHFCLRLLQCKNLDEVATWLNARQYLPIAGKHFELVSQVVSVGGWEVEWYAFKPLIDGVFVPPL